MLSSPRLVLLCALAVLAAVALLPSSAEAHRSYYGVHPHRRPHHAGSYHGRRRYHGHYHGGRYHTHGGRGYHRRRYHRRYRRDVSEADDNAFDFESVVFKSLQMDHYDCMKRMVCMAKASDAAVTPDNAAQQFVLQDLFGIDSVEDLEVGSHLVRLDVAGLIGADGGVERCASEYLSCPQTDEQTFEDFFETIVIQEVDGPQQLDAEDDEMQAY